MARQGSYALLREAPDREDTDSRRLHLGSIDEEGPGGAQQGPGIASADDVNSSQLDVVQFACHFFYIDEDSDFATIHLIRLGALDKACSVDYHTQDNSAKAGVNYKMSSGSVTFYPHEEMKDISVPILNNDYFQTNLDFKVVIDKPVGCTLPSESTACRVLILDDDVFPSNRFREKVKAQDLNSVGLRLLFHFIVFCVKRIPVVGWRTGWTLFLDQLHNVNYLVAIHLNMYLVNAVLMKGDEENLWIPGHRLWTAVAVTAALTLPKALLSLFEYLQTGRLAVAGKVKLHLKTNLFRKYLYFSAKSLSETPPGSVIRAVEDDINELVALGFMVIFQLAQQFVKVIVILFFLVRNRPSTALPLLVYPIAMAVVLNLRYWQTLELKDGIREAETTVLTQLRDAFHDLSLIKEYSMRNHVVNRFEKSVFDTIGPTRRFLEYDFRTLLVMPWITNIAIACFTVLGAYFVMNDMLSLGAFLATINIYKDAGELFAAFYQHLNNCYTVIGSLLRVVTLMNMSTDADGRARQMQRGFDGMREQFEATGDEALTIDSGESRFDRLSIKLVDVSLATDRGGPQIPALQNINAIVPQGKLVAILGSHGIGKYFLLRMIKGSVTPLRGHVYIPAHLKCIIVPRQPQLFSSGTLLENLTFGSEDDSLSLDSPDKGAYNKERLIKICKMIGFNKHSLSMMEEEFSSKAPIRIKNKDDALNEFHHDHHVPWDEQMAGSELLKMSMIRALYRDPEILLFQRPVDDLEADHAAGILSAFRKFVDERGLCKDKALQAKSRPHTVFFTSGADRERTESAMDIADVTWNLSENGFTQQQGGSKQVGSLGNRIVKSWSKEARRVHVDLVSTQGDLEMKKTEFQKLKHEHSHAKEVLNDVRTELRNWELEADKVPQNQSTDLFGCTAREKVDDATKRRLTHLRSNLTTLLPETPRPSPLGPDGANLPTSAPVPVRRPENV